MKIADLRKELTIQQKISSDDGRGGKTDPAWNDVVSVMGGIKPLSSFERSLATNIQTGVSHRITIRYRELPAGEIRLTSGSRIYKIIGQAIDVDERNRWLQIKVEELG